MKDVKFIYVLMNYCSFVIKRFIVFDGFLSVRNFILTLKVYKIM